MKNKLVSVITPTLNRREMLLRCVRSVKEQSYPYIEHIILGDCCPIIDEMEEEIKKINPNTLILNLQLRISPHLEYVSARIARARNKGVEIAKGYYIAHLDDDNTIEKNHIYSLVETIESEPDTDAAHSYRKLYTKDWKPYRKHKCPWGNKEYAKYVYDRFIEKGIFHKNSNKVSDTIVYDNIPLLTIDTSEWLIKKDIHLKFPFETVYDERQIMSHITEDYLLIKKMHEAGLKIKCTGKYTLNYYLGGYSNE